MGGFGGSRVSAQPVRAGGHCAGHGRPRKFVLQASPGSWESLARSPHGESRCKQGFGGAENVPQAGAWPSKPRGRAAGRDSRARHWLKPLPTKLAEKRTYTHLRSRRRLFGPLSSGFKHRQSQGGFPNCAGIQLAGTKNTLHATIRLQTTLQSFA